MNILELLVIGHQSVENFHQLAEMYKFKHIASVKENQIVIGYRLDNMINVIINHNLILATNVNSIVMIE